MAWTMTMRRSVLGSRGTASKTLPTPFAAIMRLLAGATSALRRFFGILAAYLPWDRRAVPGSKTALGMWRALGGAPRVQRRGGRNCADF